MRENQAETSSELKISKYLDCNTAHITKKDDELFRNAAGKVKRFLTGFGYWVHVSPKDSPIEEYTDDMEDAGYSAAAVAIVQMADRHGCDYILFSSDGFFHAHFPVLNR